MAKYLDFFNENGYLNTAGTDMIMYYDTVKHDFIAIDARKHVNKNRFIVLPFRESFRSDVWSLFYRSLLPEHLEIIGSFNERHGFFDFLEEKGLKYIYDESFEIIAEAVLKEWLNANRITLNLK